jgi:hypothetical protein
VRQDLRLLPQSPTTVLSDNGSEFEADFDRLLRERGIKRWYTYPKTPKMNAHAERPHHTLGQRSPLSFLLQHQPECQRYWTHTDKASLNHLPFVCAMFNLNIQVTDPSNSLSAYPLLIPTVKAAVNYINQFVEFNGTLNLQLWLDPSISLEPLALGGGAMFAAPSLDGSELGYSSFLIESRTGVDPNPGNPDITIIINPSPENMGRFWFDPNITSSLTSSVPEDKFDAFSTIVHELLHGMGFNGSRDPVTGDLRPGELESVWDSLISIQDGKAYFTGKSVVDLIGSPVEVMLGNDEGIYHLGHAPDPLKGEMPWLLWDVMDYAILGERKELGRLDLAILQDLGWTIKKNTVVDVVNQPDHSDVWHTPLYMVGWDDAEQLTGGALNDRIEGRGGDDVLLGMDGDDLLIGGAGNDTIRGGAGMDTAAWNGPANRYILKVFPDHMTVSDTTNAEGVDQVYEVEKLQFSDRTIDVQTKAHGSYADLPKELYQFFVVAFDAAPGVVYMDQLAEAYRHGLTVPQIVDIFTTKPQFTGVYGTDLTTSQFAEKLIDRVVGDSASSSAKTQATQDVVDALGIGWSRGKVIYTIFSNLAQKPFTDVTWGGTAQLFANEVKVAQYYTDVLGQSTEDLSTLRAAIADVHATSDVSSDDALATIVGVGLMSSGLA